jgi:hypothetical protein
MQTADAAEVDHFLARHGHVGAAAVLLFLAAEVKTAAAPQIDHALTLMPRQARWMSASNLLT